MTVVDQIAPFLPLAHLGHWYFIPLYLAPAFLILFSALRTTLKERRQGREQPDESKDPR
jgi:hypothetical protein